MGYGNRFYSFYHSDAVYLRQIPNDVMIRKQAYHVAHDNPILARVRQFHEAKKSDPYIIFVENKNTTNTQIVLFDAQNNLGTQGNNLPTGVSVNTKLN